MRGYYEDHAALYASRTVSADMTEQYERFLPLLKEEARILDVGSGSGRDASFFQRRGYEVTALEPSGNLCREIRKVFSGEIICSRIQDYRPSRKFDGIWACASLIHLEEWEILRFFEGLDQYLADNGIIYISGKNGIITGTAADGRYFLEFREELVEKILAISRRLKLEQLWYSEDVTGRRGFRWMNGIMRLKRDGG